MEIPAGSTDLRKLSADINYRLKWIDIAGLDADMPTLKFVDMGEYGTPTFLQYFRQWADSTSAWQARQKLTKGKVKDNGKHIL